MSSQGYAQGVQDFTFTSFDVDYRLTNDDPQGTLEITETMQLTFSGQNRGILRAIPKTYKDNSLDLTILDIQRDGEPESFITYEENDNTVIRIGDPDVYITGEHAYVISYRVENVITFYDTHDELFWDVNGDQWLQSFDSVNAHLVHSATIHRPTPAVCFTGVNGSTESSCAVVEDTNTATVETSRQLQAGETLTFVQGFEKGYFTESTWLEQYWQLLLAIPVGLTQLIAGLSARRKWDIYGRDPKKRSTAPFFGRPKNVSVMQASYVASNRMDTKALSANIIDLSIRGYIKIIERKSGRSIKHDLVLLKTDFTDINEEEKVLLDALFDSRTIHAVVELESKKQKLSATLKKITDIVDVSTKEKG